ncbi:MAG: hypothetical protein ACON5O_05800 [Lentimonas sp.]
MNTNRWVWFWVGFVFELVGVIAFYAYHNFYTARKSQPAAAGQRR